MFYKINTSTFKIVQESINLLTINLSFDRVQQRAAVSKTPPQSYSLLVGSAVGKINKAETLVRALA